MTRNAAIGRLAACGSASAAAALLLVGGAPSAGGHGEIAFSAYLSEAQIYSVRLDGSEMRLLTGEAYASDSPTESPDGRHLAFDSKRAGQWEIYLARSGGGAPRNITRNPASDFEPSWSPDGRWIVFVSRRGGGKANVYKMRADGTRVTRLTKTRTYDEYPGWSPDGRRIVFDRERDKDHSDVYVIGANGGKATRLTRGSADNWGARWSRDGRLAYTETRLRKDGEWPSGIVIMNGNGAHKHYVTKPGGESGIQRDMFPTWSPDGRRLAFYRTRGDHGIWAINPDGSHAQQIVESWPLGDGLGLSWTRHGRLLFWSEQVGIAPIVAMPAAGGERRQITRGFDEDSQPRWSPDSRELAFNRFVGENGSDEVFVTSAGGANARNLTRHRASDQQPSWAPDGRQIVFATNRGSDTTLVDLYVMKADGSNARPLVSSALNDTQPDWSPDGSRIAFTRFPANTYDEDELPGDIYTVTADGSDEQRLTTRSEDDEQPRWSPDGRTIAFTSFRDGRHQLYLMNADGKDQHRLLASNYNDEEPAWSPNGQQLVFTRFTKTSVEIWTVNTDGSKPARLTTTCAVTYEDSPSDDCLAWPPTPTWR
jgi:Tol biopolymer transport system component